MPLRRRPMSMSISLLRHLQCVLLKKLKDNKRSILLSISILHLLLVKNLPNTERLVLLTIPILHLHLLVEVAKGQRSLRPSKLQPTC
jgi:hypothetical protein